jgi:hypothetical protein
MKLQITTLLQTAHFLMATVHNSHACNAVYFQKGTLPWLKPQVHHLQQCKCVWSKWLNGSFTSLTLTCSYYNTQENKNCNKKKIWHQWKLREIRTPPTYEDQSVQVVIQKSRRKISAGWKMQQTTYRMSHHAMATKPILYIIWRKNVLCPINNSSSLLSSEALV